MRRLLRAWCWLAGHREPHDHWLTWRDVASVCPRCEHVLWRRVERVRP